MLMTELIFGTIVILACVIFHVFVLIRLSKILSSRFSRSDDNLNSNQLLLLLVCTTLVLVCVHAAEAWVWALIYYSLGEFDSLKEALYFSVVTSTTLGYGDITLSARWQLLAGFEAIGGLILFGVSTAFLLGVMNHLFKNVGSRDTQRPS